MSYTYEICPDCGGIKWVQLPDYNEFQDSGTDAVTMKGCTCPPKTEPTAKPQPEVSIACPHCGGYIVFEVKGNIKFDFTQMEEI